MAVTIGSAGVTFNDATVQSTAGIILDTSSSSSTTDYRLGVTILVSHTGAVAVNTASTLYINDTRRAFLLDPVAGGLTLSGTWRARGSVFVDQVSPGKGNPGIPYYAILYQRVA